jgi:hypothetical protein
MDLMVLWRVILAPKYHHLSFSRKSIINISMPKQSQKPKTFVCFKPGCHNAYAYSTGLSRHLREAHEDFVPRPRGGNNRVIAPKPLVSRAPVNKQVKPVVPPRVAAPVQVKPAAEDANF